MAVWCGGGCHVRERSSSQAGESGQEKASKGNGMNKCPEASLAGYGVWPWQQTGGSRCMGGGHEWPPSFLICPSWPWFWSAGSTGGRCQPCRVPPSISAPHQPPGWLLTSTWQMPHPRPLCHLADPQGAGTEAEPIWASWQKLKTLQAAQPLLPL